MTFKLQVGSVCKLKEVLRSTHRSDDWRTGLYRVRAIYSSGYQGDRQDPRYLSYQFEKIRRDGTRIKSFNNGYRCLAWDEFIDQGKVEIISQGEQ